MLTLALYDSQFTAIKENRLFASSFRHKCKRLLCIEIECKLDWRSAKAKTAPRAGNEMAMASNLMHRYGMLPLGTQPSPGVTRVAVGEGNQQVFGDCAHPVVELA